MNKRWIVGSVVVLAVAGVVLGVWLRPGTPVEMVSPEYTPIRAFVEEQAVTELPHDHLIAMPIPGWLEQIEWREGDRVTAGQIVARLDTDDLADVVHQHRKRIAVLETRIAETADHRLEKNALVQTEATVKAVDETVKASEAKLEAFRAVKDFAKSELERIKNISQVDAASARELREAEMNWRKSEAEYRSNALELAALKTLAAVSYLGPKFILDYVDRKTFQKDILARQLEEARLELEIAQRNLARAEIDSPIDGVVLERHQTRRQYLAAGTPLLTLGRLEDIEVIAEILTERATRIRPGDPVEIFGQAIGDGPIMGRVLRIYPAGFTKISSLGVEQQRVKVAVGFDDRPANLGVAFRVYVRIIYDQDDDALVLPRMALFRGRDATTSPKRQRGTTSPIVSFGDRDATWQVMLVRNGRTQLQTVQVGLMNDEQAQILAGLTPEDQVIARPSQDITDDMPVTIRRD